MVGEELDEREVRSTNCLLDITASLARYTWLAHQVYISVKETDSRAPSYQSNATF